MITRKNSRLLAILFAIILCLSMAACGSGNAGDEEPDISDSEYTENGIEYDEEVEGVDLVFKKAAVDKFYGSWTADSDQALYLLGNVDISIKEDGSWSGNIADEDLSGEWKETDEGISVTSDLFNYTLSYTDKDVLVMQYLLADDSGEKNTIVLKAK